MVGITNWQQQVPLPQDYTGANAWKLPLHPSPAASPLSIRGRFLRGAIALAANGVPIFNPQNNRGEVSAEIGELDQWGGHCGRADDYHYHAAPLHLQDKVGKGNPIAVALDGYPIYGLTDPDGSVPKDLDAFNGHSTTQLGYHYHASNKYPYVNGGFHGQVTEVDGQVDPQPFAQPARPAAAPLHGAKITGFEEIGKGSYKLTYLVGADTRSILYSVGSNNMVTFEYRNGKLGTNVETSVRGTDGKRPHAAQAGGPPVRTPGAPLTPQPPERRRAHHGPPGLPAESAPHAADSPSSIVPVSSDSSATASAGKTGERLTLMSPVVTEGGLLPVEFTGDGSGISPPIAWKGAPASTKAFAVIMHHIDPEGKTKWYWTLYNLPPQCHGLPKDVKGIGLLGNNSVNRGIGYAPPHSKGPGPKTYIITLYALSEPLSISAPPSEINRDLLLEAMKGKVLASSELHVVAIRTAADNLSNDKQPPRPPDAHDQGPRDNPPPPPLPRNPTQ